jgi:hypothetical protein
MRAAYALIEAELMGAQMMYAAQFINPHMPLDFGDDQFSLPDWYEDDPEFDYNLNVH